MLRFEGGVSLEQEFEVPAQKHYKNQFECERDDSGGLSSGRLVDVMMLLELDGMIERLSLVDSFDAIVNLSTSTEDLLFALIVKHECQVVGVCVWENQVSVSQVESGHIHA